MMRCIKCNMTLSRQVYCVISKLASLELYNVLLNKLTELHAVSEAAVHGFLSATVSKYYCHRFNFFVLVGTVGVFIYSHSYN